MSASVTGLHHVTAISADAQRNLDYYTRALGQRFVKRTVNFDDPGTYHLYYGDRLGAPGTVMTFFPWANARPGRIGAGQVSITQFAIPRGAMGFWEERLTRLAPELGGRVITRDTAFGEPRLIVQDPDGLILALVETDDARTPWLSEEISAEHALRGFHGVTLALTDGAATQSILEDVFEYALIGREPVGGDAEKGALIRLASRHGDAARIVDLHVNGDIAPGVEGAGTVHHVAFSVADRAAQRAVRARLTEAGLRVTDQIDRDYFWAIYARTPGGVLFEVATAEPGFTADEPEETLGEALKIPAQHAHLRERIEAALPALTVR